MKHPLQDKKLIEINQITISSCSVYLSGEYYTMDRALHTVIHNVVYRVINSK